MLKVLVAGVGGYSDEAVDKIEKCYEITAFIGAEAHEKGIYVMGAREYRVIPPEEIKRSEFDKVVIADKKNATELFRQLLGLGVKEHDIIVDYVSIKKMIATQELFERQIDQFHERNRLDIIVKYLAIDNYYKKNTYGYQLYKKMQEKRLRLKDAGCLLHQFVQLIVSFDKNGFRADSYIICDEDLRIMDGTHRMACSLYFDIPSVQVKVVPQKFGCDYGTGWFLKHGFLLEEIETIHSGLRYLLK